MLSFFYGSYYEMIPISFESKEPIHLEIGTVVCRSGPLWVPDFLKDTVGMLHFGLIKSECHSPLTLDEYETSQRLSKSHFKNEAWIRSFHNKHNFFQRYQVQHYVKRGSDAQVKETSFGAFLFGEDAWNRGSWYRVKVPKTFRVMIPSQNIEQLQRKLHVMNKTLGNKDYKLWSQNCENYVMAIALGKNVTEVSSIQAIAVFVILGVILILVIVILVLVAKRKKSKSTRIYSSKSAEKVREYPSLAN